MAAVILVVLLILPSVYPSPDWTDCPQLCTCKWISGKKTALCKDAGFTAIPKLHLEMQVLDLSGNYIHNLQQEVFKSAGLINLQRIFLSNSGLANIHHDAFLDLIILVEVDLSRNNLKHLHPETFRGNARLRMLLLSYNPLGQLIRRQFPDLPYLRTLEMEHCYLESVHKDAFINLSALETLNLKYNLLQNISEATFMNFAHLKTLKLDGNPWRCDCELRGFRNWFLVSKLQSEPLVCAEPLRLLDKLWENVPSQDFACAPTVTVSPGHQVRAEAGGNVTFGCQIIGDPEPQVSWMFEGYPINHTWLVVEAEEGLLHKWTNISVYNVSDADVGIYTCVAKNVVDLVSANVTLVVPEVVTATTLSKSEIGLLWWGIVLVSIGVLFTAVCTVMVVWCVRARHRQQRKDFKASVSFNDQEKKLLDVSIATTTDRGTGSCEALGSDMALMEPPVHITIESEPMPLTVYPAPPPEFSTSLLPTAAYGNIFIQVSVTRDRAGIDTTMCPDLLDLPHRPKPMYHGMATLPRRPMQTKPKYDNMGPRVTAGGSSTLSLPGSAEELPPPPPPPSCATKLASEFVSL